MKIGRPPKEPKSTINCACCGKAWQDYEWKYPSEKRYCSRACFYKSRVGRKNDAARIEPEEHACIRCGKKFLVGGEGRRKRSSKYCSRTCSRLHYWASRRKSIKELKEHSQAREMTDMEATWLAGFFDGEGCVGWPRRHILHSVYLSITNTNEDIMNKVAAVTGTGRIKLKIKSNPRHSQAWTWNCYGDNARYILRQMLPWLIIKREAAEAALGISKATEPPWTQRSRTMRAARVCE